MKDCIKEMDPNAATMHTRGLLSKHTLRLMLRNVQFWTVKLKIKLHILSMANLRGHSDDLKIYHVNCQLLVAIVGNTMMSNDEFYNFPISDYHIICLTETYLSVRYYDCPWLFVAQMG